jgi:hypothetical protein
MPRITATPQQPRPAKTQVRAANFQATASPRANTTGQSTPAYSTTQAAQPCSCGCTACAGLECLDRTRFFAGQLLSEADLNNEQSYWLAKSRLHNRYLHGWGIVCGLQVSCDDCDGWVTINPGYAIDPCGNDIIVCSGQSFNVLQAIQACCRPKPQSDCSPLRYSPSPNCQDAIQTWCITIEYKEQSSRMVTPLQQTSAKSSGCGCGGTSSGGCGCGCGGSKNSGSMQASTSCSCATASTTTTTASCEATRIVEGFQLGVCQAPPAANTTTGYTSGSATAKPGSFGYQFDLCYTSLNALLKQQPSLAVGISDQAAYQAASQYLASAKSALAAVNSTDCQLSTSLAAIQIAAPGATPADGYIKALQGQIKQIAVTLFAAVLDCLCFSLLPPCPAESCDQRLTLACVTVKDGQIIDICHFGGGRKQLITFPVLGYWGSIFGLDTLLGTLGDALEKICCGDISTISGLLSVASSQGEVLSSSPGQPAAFHRAMFSSVAQRLGAPAVNAASSNDQTEYRTQAVDLRPLVGLDSKAVLATLASNSLTGNLTTIDVSSDPSWTDAAVAAGASYAPSAFRSSDPLTMYTKGSAVVGFKATSPTEVLSAQVAALQQQVSDLQTQIGGTTINVAGSARPETGAPKTTRKK